MPRALRALAVTVVAGVALGAGATATASSLTPTPSPASPGPVLRRAAPDQIVLSGRVIVPRGQSAGEIFVFRGRAQVAGVAREDVVVVVGEIAVTGQVSGSVVALDGDVTVAPSAQVQGDVLASGEVHVAPGAQVAGSVRQHVVFSLRGRLGALSRFLSWFAVTVSTLLLGLALVWLAPRALDGASQAITGAPWASIGWGIVTAIAGPALSLLLLASVLGVPLGLAILLGLLLVLSVGYVLCAFAFGSRLVKPPHGRLQAFLAGWGTLRVVGLIPFVSGVVWVAAAVVGVGGGLVGVWRARGAGQPGRHRAGYMVRRAGEPAPPEEVEVPAGVDGQGGSEIV